MRLSTVFLFFFLIETNELYLSGLGHARFAYIEKAKFSQLPKKTAHFQKRINTAL